MPFDFVADRAAVAEKLATLPLTPFISPDTHRRVSIPDVVQNVALFVPFGAFGVLTLRRRWSTLAAVAATIAAGAAVSFSVETLQLFEADRTASISDLCANTLGAACGAIATVWFTWAARASLTRLNALGVAAVPAFYPMMLAAVLLCAAAWQPFDFTLDVGTLVAKARAVGADVWQVGEFRDEGIEVVRNALFGLSLSLWLRQLRVRGAPFMGAAVAALCACGLEAGQWVVGSRMPGLQDAAVHTAGGVAGAALSAGWPHGRSPRFWWGLLVAAVAAGAVLQLLAPFHWGAVHRPIQWVPFANYYERTTLQTLSHAVELALMYAPVGFGAAAAFRGRKAAWAAAVLTISVAFPLEWLQGWTIDRYGDVTDVMLSAGGAVLGVWVGGPGRRQFARWLGNGWSN